MSGDLSCVNAERKNVIKGLKEKLIFLKILQFPGRKG